MPSTVEVQVYQFAELSEEAKETARQWFRECSDSSDFDFVIEDAASALEILGFSLRQESVKLYGGGTRYDPVIRWELGYSQGDGAGFESTYAYAKGSAKKIREERPTDTTLQALANRLQALQKLHGYRLTGSTAVDGRSVYSSVGVEIPREDFYKVYQDAYDEFKSIVSDLGSWIYDQLRAEDEYQNADAQVDDNIEANEYTFTEEGNIF